MEMAYCSKTLANTDESTRRKNLEEKRRHSHCRENTISQTGLVFDRAIPDCLQTSKLKTLRILS